MRKGGSGREGGKEERHGGGEAGRDGGREEKVGRMEELGSSWIGEGAQDSRGRGGGPFGEHFAAGSVHALDDQVVQHHLALGALDDVLLHAVLHHQAVDVHLNVQHTTVSTRHFPFLASKHMRCYQPD